MICCELWCDVKCGARCIRNVVRCGMSVAIRHGVMWNATEMQNVEYDALVCGICIMKAVESYNVM